MKIGQQMQKKTKNNNNNNKQFLSSSAIKYEAKAGFFPEGGAIRFSSQSFEYSN